MGHTACPKCGYDPYAAAARTSKRTASRQSKSRRQDRWAIAIWTTCVVLACLGLVTRQIMILGGLLALLLGGFLLHSAFFTDSHGSRHPLLTRVVEAIFGGVYLLGGIGAWVYALLRGVAPFPPRYSLSDLQAIIPYIVIGVVLFLFNQGARLVDRWLARLEGRLQGRYRELGTVYPIPPLMPRQICLFAILVTTPLFLFLTACSLNAEATGFSPQGAIGFPVILLILVSPMAYLIHRGSGFVVLTDRGVILRRLWGQRNIPYEDIVRVKERGLGLPLNLVVEGKTGTLRIPRSVRNLPQLYRRLLANSRQSQHAARQEPLTLPYTLTVPWWTWLLHALAVPALLAFWAAIALIPYWVPAVHGQPLPALSDFLADRNALAVMGVLAVLSGALFVPVILLAGRESIAPRQPWTLVLAEDEIRWRCPASPWQAKPADAIARIELEPIHRRVRARHDGAVATAQYTVYALHVHFKDGEQLTVGHTRLTQWHIPPERLREMLRGLYC